ARLTISWRSRPSVQPRELSIGLRSLGLLLSSHLLSHSGLFPAIIEDDMSKQQFQTEVSQLLQLIVHSLYSHPEIFLRELISNSSDALDKLRHLTLTDDKYKALVGKGIDAPRIDLTLDEEKKTLTISDTGIGMSEEDLASH